MFQMFYGRYILLPRFNSLSLLFKVFVSYMSFSSFSYLKSSLHCNSSDFSQIDYVNFNLLGI